MQKSELFQNLRLGTNRKDMSSNEQTRRYSKGKIVSHILRELMCFEHLTNERVQVVQHPWPSESGPTGNDHRMETEA